MLATIKSAGLTLAFALLFVALGIPADRDVLGVLFVALVILFWRPRRLRREF